ncbi:MAG: glycerophosphodiester phosphodiesterase [Polyangiales bacterium]
MARGLAVLVSLVVVGTGCSSSSSQPIDPVATAYCAECSEDSSCEPVVSETILAACTEETRAWYDCAIENACVTEPCDALFDARTLCLRRSPRDQVKVRFIAVRPSANLGHRGVGPTSPENPFPENSISSFVAAMDAGADGISFDVEITADGQLVIMHDDTLDRTTDCTGCVSAMTLDEIRTCRLLDGEGSPTEQPPPTLLEAYGALEANAIMDLEMKVFGEDCQTDTTGPEELATRVLEEVTLLGGEGRTVFSSFDETAAALVKTERPGYYAALLSANPGPELVEKALELDQDAIHPLFTVTAETVQAALDAGLQVNIWTVNTAELMAEQIEKGSTGIITDNPAILVEVLEEL